MRPVVLAERRAFFYLAKVACGAFADNAFLPVAKGVAFAACAASGN
jgi:hypothetical protein